MKTIIIGYTDTQGHGAKILLGLEADENKKAALMQDAKRLHKFPKGIVRLEQCTLQVGEIAIFISDKVTEQCAEADLFRRQRADSILRERTAAEQRADELRAAEKQMRGAAEKRNVLISQIASLRTRRQQELDRQNSSAAEKVAADIAALEPEVNQSAAEFKYILDRVHLLRDPKTTAEARATAVAELKNPEGNSREPAAAPTA